MKIRLIKNLKLRNEPQMRIDKVFEVFTGPGSETADDGQVWVKCPGPSGYCLLDEKEYEVVELQQ